MPYDSQEYEADQQMNVPEALEGTITATASGQVVTIEDVSKIRFFQNVKLTGIAALIDTAAACASPVIKLMNGATTLASVAISGAVGDIVAGSIASPNVEFTDFVSDKDLIKWYQKAKVICQLSYYEAFGLAPAEGMACGCVPVVTKERVGLSELVGDTGFYVPYNDTKATADAIKKALLSSEKGKMARERINEMFSIEKREKKLVNIVGGEP